MKRKTMLTVAALITLITALIYLAILVLAQFGILPQEQTEDSLFVKGYLFLPLPLVGFVAAILLQVWSVRPAKKKKQ